MPITNPSQYECDRMKQGDLIYVQHRNLFYRIYRTYFGKDKIILKVRANWISPPTYKYYYQEDCTLIKYWESLCIKKFDKEVPCAFSLNKEAKPYKVKYLKSLEVGLYNTQIVFDDNKTLTIPTSFFNEGIKANERTLKEVNQQDLLEERLKFIRYKGDYFKNKVKEDNIIEWIPCFCQFCGEPVRFFFNEEGVTIENACTCNMLKLNMDHLSYDEFAIWYANQTNPDIMKIYEEFWFRKEG